MSLTHKVEVLSVVERVDVLSLVVESGILHLLVSSSTCLSVLFLLYGLQFGGQELDLTKKLHGVDFGDVVDGDVGGLVLETAVDEDRRIYTPAGVPETLETLIFEPL
jgi:hypothetical protein